MSRRRRHQQFSAPNAAVGTAGIFMGLIAGFIIGSSQGQGTVGTAQAAAVKPETTASAEVELTTYRSILAKDADNLQANIDLANKLYDAGRYAEALPFYQRAVTLDPKNANVSTDYGTSLYYAGRVDEALAQLQKSLAADPTHAQTLFNIGIIRRDAKKDLAGAVDAWEQLLKVAPGYADAERVRSLLVEAKNTPAK